MQENSSIPEEARSQNLKSFLREMLDTVVHLRSEDSPWQSEYPIDLYSLVYLWLIDADEEIQKYQQEKQALTELGFDGEARKAQLIRILQEDTHLKECCVTEFTLARWLNQFVVRSLEFSEGKLPTEEEFNDYYEKFTDYTYLQPFLALSYSHLFNFTTESDLLNFGNAEVVKLNQSEIVTLLGEYTSLSFMHFQGTGEYFIRSGSNGLIENDIGWLLEEREKADNLARIFQYYKDGIVHINYTSQYFLPEWVNQFRKHGNFHIGNIRKFPHEMGNSLFSVNEAEYEELAQWWTLFQEPDIADKFGEDRNKLGKALEAAGTFYESSHTHFENVRRLIDLSITLEALFSPYNQNEISHQLAELAGHFIGKTGAEKQQIYQDLKKLYGKRSKLFHGSYDAHSEEFITTAELDNFSSLMRRGLLQFVTMYLRGAGNHKDIIERIRLSFFDPEEGNRLKEESNLRSFIVERLSNSG